LNFPTTDIIYNNYYRYTSDFVRFNPKIYTVLLGGLNYYVDVYSNPDPPEGVYADSEIFNYQFRVSAGQYLMGDIQQSATTAAKTEPVKIKLPKKRKKKTSGGDEGC
jgi:hypothetical protein